MINRRMVLLVVCLAVFLVAIPVLARADEPTKAHRDNTVYTVLGWTGAGIFGTGLVLYLSEKDGQEIDYAGRKLTINEADHAPAVALMVIGVGMACAALASQGDPPEVKTEAISSKPELKVLPGAVLLSMRF